MAVVLYCPTNMGVREVRGEARRSDTGKDILGQSESCPARILATLRRCTTLGSADSVSISQRPRRLHTAASPRIGSPKLLASGVSPVGNGLAIESGVIRVLCHGGYAQSE